MKKENVLYLFFLSIFVTGCSSDKQSYEDLPYIDVRKDYPEKEINLTDIADVTYLHLSTVNDDFLYRGSIACVTQNTIVVIDRSSHSVLFFSKDGTPKSRFNRKGQGPEEYVGVEFTMYDEEKDDVYILPSIFYMSRYINVYSSSGEYKRKLTLPQGALVDQMFFFDEQSILVYDNRKLLQNMRKNYSEDNTAFMESIDSSFFLISKTEGKVLEYIPLPSNNVNLSFRDDMVGFAIPGFARVRKCPDGLFLYNPETDTVFLFSKDKFLTPYMCKKPLLSDLNPMTVMDICMDAGRFQFMSVIPYLVNGKISPDANYYMRDKKTGEIFRQKIILPDYKGKDFYFDPRRTSYYEKAYHFELDLTELEEAYRENRLSGKLKKLVATLNEDEDNNVFMLVDFK
ncbi:MAG: 6-bladed beta-propeller [Tannerella sp.]|jgi:hypothetical protein|nr:6-bladed beta-propeller [Tannerella sp.]